MTRSLRTLVGALVICLLCSACAAGEVTSEDATVRWSDQVIEFQTAAVEHQFTITNGTLVRVAWVDRKNGATNLLRNHPIEDFRLQIHGGVLSSADPGWRIATPVCEKLAHGELRLRLELTRDDLRVIRSYIVYPHISLVRGWLEITALGPAPTILADPPLASLAMAGASLDLKWMSGAELTGDSWKLRTERLGADARRFDSYDPPPGMAHVQLPGDGTDARILLNDKPIWPAAGWAHSAHSSDVVRHELTADVRAGDQLKFVLSRGQQMSCDTTQWDPVIAYADGQRFQASEGFSTEQGKNGWSYLYLRDDGTEATLSYADVPGRYGKRWRLKLDVIEPFVAETEMHPDPQGCAVRVFTAPRDGQVSIVGTVRNTGNGAPPGPGFRLGTMTYAPWFCLMDPATGQAAYVGFDCMAHWRADIAPAAGEGTDIHICLAGYSQQLKPGQTVRTPYTFMGLFGADLDQMGQELLEWQYGYLWDYTREPWFPGVRMLGYWMKGTSWGAQGWVGGAPDTESAYRKIFRTADFMRCVGGDTYHRDWGWWDRAGDWNGPDFRTSGEYLRKYGMGQLIYAFIYTVDPESSVAQAHPEWLANPSTLDQSMPEVVDYEVALLDRFCQQWGAYQWRNDSFPLAPRDGNDTVLLGQQQGFMEVLRRFLDDHPDCAFQGVNGGGMGLHWEYLAFASGFQFTDGQALMLADYYASYLFPPDKINNMPDIWDPNKYDPATWRGLLCSNFDLTGDTFDPEKLEGLRDLIDVYHYLQSQGVVGRWVRVYHPAIEGDDETMYLQRMSWDQQRGIVITKHKIEGSVIVRPKGLLADQEYEVGFHASPAVFRQRGSELMSAGITLNNPAPGELIYFNLPDHPGNTIDHTPPPAPKSVAWKAARHMGVRGVEVTWDASTDDHWLSYYVVQRDGEKLDRVAKGNFYFDHSAGADPAAKYEICAVDGSGNTSEAASASVSAPDQPRRMIVDDADNTRLTLQGSWQQDASVRPSHGGTLSCAHESGATCVLHFTGRAVVWHSRLGAEGDLARVTIDGGDPVQVSCYSADEIPGWPLFERAWPDAREHVLKIEVLGQRDKRSAGARVWLDAVSIEP
jgi:hypothetical protein